MGSWFRRTTITDYAKAIPVYELRKKLQIVVIDDDPNAFPADLLRKEGYHIEYWGNVQSLDRLERGEFDIIVLDIGGVAQDLNPADGLGVLDHLKRVNPAQIVVAFSGQSFDIQKTRFFKVADDCLSKPTDALKCKQILDALIESRITVQRLWDSTREMLLRHGVEQRRVSRIERELTKALRAGRKPDVGGILETYLERAAPISALLAKILTLCGF